MERTGLNATVLLRLINVKGFAMSKGTLSDIAAKRRRCSLRYALVLEEITGVPARRICEWPPVMGDARGDRPADFREYRSSPASAEV